MGEVVCHHHIIETLLNEKEIRKKLEEWKPQKKWIKKNEINQRAQTHTIVWWYIFIDSVKVVGNPDDPLEVSGNV